VCVYLCSFVLCRLLLTYCSVSQTDRSLGAKPDIISQTDRENVRCSERGYRPTSRHWAISRDDIQTLSNFDFYYTGGFPLVCEGSY
jgi:hypothetical protein